MSEIKEIQTDILAIREENIGENSLIPRLSFKFWIKIHLHLVFSCMYSHLDCDKKIRQAQWRILGRVY